MSEAGDDTTASVVLAHAIISAGMKVLASCTSPVLLRSGIDKVIAKVVAIIKRMAIPAVCREGQIARIAANGDDEIGDTVTKADGTHLKVKEFEHEPVFESETASSP